MMHRSDYLFEETQRFTQWWIWIFVGGSVLTINASLIHGVIQQIIMGKPWGDEPLPDEWLLLATALCLSLVGLLLWAFMYSALEIRVTRFALEYKFMPFIRTWKSIERVSIAGYEIKKIPFLKGYGIRLSLNGNKLLNVKGSHGVTVTLHDGSLLTLGTQQPEKLAGALDQITKSNS